MPEPFAVGVPIRPRVLFGDLVFAEGPRWHDDALWFSDMHGAAIHRLTLAGEHDVVLETAGRKPSGLGFLPDGDLLFVSMAERSIMRYDGAKVTVHADLSGLTDDELNDMVVDGQGRAYVGSYPRARGTGVIVQVDPDGAARVAADNMDFPNGTVISADGATLIVTESMARHHTAFDIAADGALSGRRVYAAVADGAGDGLAMDAQGALWSAMPLVHQFVRVLPGGEVTDRIDVGARAPIACALGGPARQDLFLLSAMSAFEKEVIGTRNSQVAVVAVNVPGAGTP